MQHLCQPKNWIPILHRVGFEFRSTQLQALYGALELTQHLPLECMVGMLHHNLVQLYVVEVRLDLLGLEAFAHLLVVQLQSLCDVMVMLIHECCVEDLHHCVLELMHHEVYLWLILRI